MMIRIDSGHGLMSGRTWYPTISGCDAQPLRQLSFLSIASLTFSSLEFPSLISLQLLEQHKDMESDPEVGKAQLGCVGRSTIGLPNAAGLSHCGTTPATPLS